MESDFSEETRLRRSLFFKYFLSHLKRGLLALTQSGDFRSRDEGHWYLAYTRNQFCHMDRPCGAHTTPWDKAMQLID